MTRLAKVRALSIGCMLTLVAALGCEPSNEILEIRLSHSASPRSIISLSAEEFARRANERLGDRAKVVVFGSGMLGSDEIVLQKLKLGTVEIGLNSTVMSSVADEFALFEMPYLVRDREHMLQIENEIFWSELAPSAEAVGYKVLALWENGFRHVTNNRRPIVTPLDLHGVKLRTPTSPWRVKVFEGYGASPSPLPFADLFMALQTGMMDGQENPLSNVITAGLHEVQQYLSLTGHIYSPAYVVAGLERWARLPEDVRDIVEATARETQAYVFSSAARMDAEFLAQLREAGMKVNDSDRDSFIAASQAIYDEFGEAVPNGRALIDAAITLRSSDVPTQR